MTPTEILGLAKGVMNSAGYHGETRTLAAEVVRLHAVLDEHVAALQALVHVWGKQK